MNDKITYKDAGVDIANADATKKEMLSALHSRDARIINRDASFAALFAADFPGITSPVLVLKTEEPGSKQWLAFKHKRVRGICFDLINHLINDIVVMGARPLAVLDTIICGKLQKDVVLELVHGISDACREQGCSLVGGETSEQPGVLEEGSYVLSASVVGVVDRDKAIDGSRIEAGDVVLALAANGLHTNGYTLVRRLLDKQPGLAEKRLGNETFLDAIMRPHRAYAGHLLPLFDRFDIRGLAHITGGGVEGNLNRVLPANLDAKIDLAALRVLPVFSMIKEAGSVPDEDMRRTYNLGVGMTLVAKADQADKIRESLSADGCDTWVLGSIVRGSGTVQVHGTIGW